MQRRQNIADRAQSGLERRPAGDHVMEDRADPVDIRARVGLLPAAVLLRRRIAFRAKMLRILRRPFLEYPHCAKIHQRDRPIPAHNDIGRLEVPIYVRRVHVMQALQDLAQPDARLCRLLHFKYRSFLQNLLKRGALHILHDKAVPLLQLSVQSGNPRGADLRQQRGLPVKRAGRSLAARRFLRPRCARCFCGLHCKEMTGLFFLHQVNDSRPAAPQFADGLKRIRADHFDFFMFHHSFLLEIVWECSGIDELLSDLFNDLSCAGHQNCPAGYAHYQLV